MSSFYNRITGTLQTGKTARADDIHLIQSSIQKAFESMIIDMFGSGFILGQSENALKLYATDLHVDQSNLQYSKETCWISFYDTYLRQRIVITKSSIETIRVHMINNHPEVEPTIYAEIRDKNFNLVEETNTVLKRKDTTLGYNEVDFHFNKNHLEIGEYYFVIRPIDISATDFLVNDDGTPYETVKYDQFCVRYDIDGHYNMGLEASLDGKNYLDAKEISNGLQVTIDTDGVEAESQGPTENNHDLYFEEIFSSGSTYLIDDRFAAVVLGEKVYPHDTHVTIKPPSDEGNRIDLVSLTKDGTLEVISGKVYTDNEEKDIPTNTAGLTVAYITNYKASLNKVPSIEQDDTNHITRHRDILERLRRIEKRLDYESQNNAPTRIKYNCTIDPILTNDEVDNDPRIRGEGTYGVTTSTDEKGNTVVVDESAINYAWSIIKDNYTYEVEGETTEKGEITVWDVMTTPTQNGSFDSSKKGLYRYHAEAKDKSEETPQPISGLELIIEIKSGSTLKKREKIKTNKEGIANYSFFSLKLGVGTYNVYTIYGNKKIKSKLTVANSVNKYTEKSNSLTLTLPKAKKTILTHKLPEGVIAGNDSFYTENLDVDIENGEVRIKKISNIDDEYEINEGRALLKDIKGYDSKEEVHLIKKEKDNSDFPALHVTFDRDAYIKSITPYIAGFKNIESFGILIFKNDIIHNITDTRETYKKIIGADDTKKDTYDDPTFPTLYKSEYQSLKDISKESGDYKVPKEPVLFDDVNLDIEAGTYTIMICPKLESGKEEGEIKIKKYSTKKDSITYGTDERVYGSSKLSAVYISTTDAHDTSWDIAIKHKTYRYYNSGKLISKPISTGVNFSACSIIKNFIIPKNCNIVLSVSNDGGTTWEIAKTNDVKFQSSNASFRWMLEFTSNNISTPILKYNENRESAISFSLATSISFVELEDFNRCYESPLMNANSITRLYTKSITQKTFSQWEFARVFMDDNELNSRIDILISYAYDDYNTSGGTAKSAWYDTIFFSTVFADLTLEDFKQESIDYDNYEGNVEYDEYNFRFGLDSDEIMHYTGGLALASPDESSVNGEFYYGDISLADPQYSVSNMFAYKLVSTKESPYVYYGNNGDSKNMYAGMHITQGPYMKATYRNSSNRQLTSNDPIIGVRFNNGLDINENITGLTIDIVPSITGSPLAKTKSVIGNNASAKDGTETSETDSEIDDEKGPNNNNVKEKKYFPGGTFKIALSLGQNGQIDSSGPYAGKEYIIEKDLYSDEHNEIDISFIDDFKGFKTSGINSIALKLTDKALGINTTEDTTTTDTTNNTTTSLIEPFALDDSIGIGRIKTSSYNMRPYAPYTYKNWDRLKWTRCDNVKDNNKVQAWAIVSVYFHNSDDVHQILYPIDDDEDKNTTRKITTISEETDGLTSINKRNGRNCIQIWQKHGTARRKLGAYTDMPKEGYYIERKENQINAHLHFGGNQGGQDRDYSESYHSGSQTIFQCPTGVTGNLFKIDIDIPMTIYDLIDIEYYIFTRYWNSSDANEQDTIYGQSISTINHLTDKNYYNVHQYNNRVYATDGSFSKGELYFDLYDTDDIENTEPFESFALPAWGRIATASREHEKVVHAWFKKRSSNVTAKTLVLRRENPRGLDKNDIQPLKLVLNDILFVNGSMETALGPQMQLRIYPNSKKVTTNTKIRKIGAVYRL